MRVNKKSLDVFIPFLIFVLALAIRLWNFSDIEFKFDQAYAIYKANLFWENGKFPLTGLVSSTFTNNPPFFIYLLLVPVLISKNPLFISFLFALSGSCSVLILYLILKKYSLFLAISSAILFATSIWPIIFSRQIWAQDLLPLFSVLIIYFSLKKAVMPLIILSLWAFQVHFSGFLVIPFTIIVLIGVRKKIKPKALLLGLFIGFLPLFPYLFFQIKQKFVDFSLLFSCDQCSYDLNSIIKPFRLVAGLNYDYLLGLDYPEFLKTLPLVKVVLAIFNFQLLLVFIGLLLVIFKKKKLQPLALFLFLLLSLSFLSRRPVAPYYHELSLPLIFVFVGISLWQIYQIEKIGKIAGLLALIICLIANLIYVGHFYNFVHRQKQIDGDYGLVYWQKEKLVQEAIRNFEFRTPEGEGITAARVVFSVYYLDREKSAILAK